MSVRVFVCDDVAELRALVRLSFEEAGDIEVVGEAPDAESALEAIAGARPDVVVLDLSMPGLDGLEAIPKIRDAAPGAAIVVYSGFGAEKMEGRALELGADRYLEKGAPMDELCGAVREAARPPGATEGEGKS
jgi:DNA-binding NarL/FixJ family response regulator